MYKRLLQELVILTPSTIAYDRLFIGIPYKADTFVDSFHIFFALYYYAPPSSLYLHLTEAIHRM
jgi:hypothetical protein